MPLQDIDTIVAISTPPGRGGIGIVRLSGPRARDIAAPLLRLRHELAPGRARFGEILDLTAKSEDHSSAAMTAVILSEGALAPQSKDPDALHSAPDARTVLPIGPAALDQCVATFFEAPHSYTGEDVLEIAMHGSPVLLEYVVRQCCIAGARLAEPGEFTQRAFLAGRIDLTQAEAVDDLIGSSTLEQARVAARQLGGVLAKTVAPIKEELVALIATMEAGIDFAEDDIDVLPAIQITARIAAIRAPLEALEHTFAYGRVVHDGFRLAIVGRPNAGKSSLFNRLVERERAIVTATPGTTRDLVTERVAIDGIPVDLIDTAGLREASDEAERLGIAKSHEAMADADVVLLVLDATAPLSAQDQAVLDRSTSATLIAANKSDLPPCPSDPASNLEPRTLNLIKTSALTGEGIPELRAAIVAAVAGNQGGLREAGLLTNLRQHQAVQQALAGLDSARAAVDAAIPHEMLLLDLYQSLRGLDALTGATTTEDVLRLIFSKFCIGK